MAKCEGVIAYTYDADTHCPYCTELRFGRAADGFVAGEDANGNLPLDSESNPVGIITPWDEWCEPSEPGLVSLVCGTCHGIIEEHEHDRVPEPEPGSCAYRVRDGDTYPVYGTLCTACGASVHAAVHAAYANPCALCGDVLTTPQHSLFGMMVNGRFIARPADWHGFQECTETERRYLAGDR